jgi:interleukin-1 receptor-associated kinase 1
MLRGETVGSKSARHATTATVSSNKVLVAVKAEKVISNTALAWALTHIVHSSDSITLLAVYSTEKTGTIKPLIKS